MNQVKYICLVICLVIASSIKGQNADINILQKVNGWDSPGMRDFSKVMATSAEVMAVAVPVGIAIYGLCDRKSGALNKAVTIGGAVLGTLVLSEGLKLIIRRKRPYNAHPDKIINYENPGAYDSHSFPSTHTSVAFATATSLSLEYPKWYVITPAMVWAAGVGIARMNQGVHYPTDVLGGMVLGAGTAWLSYWVNKQWRKKHQMSKSTQLALQTYSPI